MAGEPGPVAAGPFNPGTLNGAETLRPTDERLVALNSRGQGELSQASAQLVQSHRYVDVQVRIHPQDQLDRFCRVVAAAAAAAAAAAGRSRHVRYPFSVSRLLLFTRRGGERTILL